MKDETSDPGVVAGDVVPVTTPEFWKDRLVETRKRREQFDVTKTWSDQERLEATGWLWSKIRKFFAMAERAVDFGCGRGRFLSRFKEIGVEYTGVDIIGDFLTNIVKEGGRFWVYREGRNVPKSIDGDAALFCLIIQHLDDDRARTALRATKARRLVIVDGVWADDEYSKSRDLEELKTLLEFVGCEKVETEVVTTPFGKYKVAVGDREDAS